LNRKLKAKIIEEYGTQADFADAIGTDEPFVSRVVRGRRTLDLERQSVWAKELGCNPKDIFADEG
jgi:transcriptional regulator with XRE-family HTH domain